MPNLNAHKVFTDSPKQNDYLSGLTLDQNQLDLLRSARDEIRTEIKKAISGWSNYIKEESLFIPVTGSNFSSVIKTPKFKMQGSMAYFTLNKPDQSPPQEIDVDDGLFVPMLFFDELGTAQPMVLSQGLFALIESALSTLCKRKNWKLDTTKPSCIRVCLDTTSHVDIALYAIPNSDYEVLVESAAARSENQNRDLYDSIELSDYIYETLSPDQIMLAHRQEGWKPSDPRKLESWFNNAINKFGPQLRRICRYFKGWRDHQWLSCKLSSIALMKCVVDAYEQMGNDLSSNRDDEAIMYISEILPGMLQSRIKNPVISGQYLDEGWSSEDRAQYQQKARAFATTMSNALRRSTGASDLLSKLNKLFGNRIPNDKSLVLDESGQPASTDVLKNDHQKTVRAVQKSGGGRYA